MTIVNEIIDGFTLKEQSIELPNRLTMDKNEILKLRNFGMDYSTPVKKSGRLGFPKIKPYLGEIPTNYVSFSDCKQCREYDITCVTGFDYDYKLMKLSNYIELYLPLLELFKCVCNPDFSMYADLGLAKQISNKLKSHEVAYILQEHGIPILPSITWSSPKSYLFCFEGFSKGGAVIVSTIGTLRNECSRMYFKNGFLEMLKVLSPDSVILYGDVNEDMQRWLPKELDIHHFSHYRFERARKNGK